MSASGQACARGPLVWIIGGALIVRLVYVLAAPQQPVADDALAYDEEAQAMAFGTRNLDDPTVIAKGPMYPAALAVVYRLVGHRQDAVRVAQALLSTWIVVMLYLIGKAVFGRAVGVTAALLASVYPPFISYAGQLLTEILATAVLVSLVYCLLRGLQGAALRWWAAAGLLSGLLVLMREEMAAIIAVLAIALIVWRVGARRVALFAGCAALIVVPWTARNLRVHDSFVLVSPSSGHQLWLSTYPEAWETWDSDDPVYRALTDGFSPAERDRRLARAAFENVRSHPRPYLRMCLRRIGAFWIGGHSPTFVGLEQPLGWYLAQGALGRASVKLGMLAYNVGLVVLGLAGAYLAWQLGRYDGRALGLLALPVAVKALLHIALFATLRYQVPIMGFVILFAAAAIGHVRSVILQGAPAHA